MMPFGSQRRTTGQTRSMAGTIDEIPLPDLLQRLRDRAQRAQREQVDLDQARVLHTILVPLDDDTAGHGRPLQGHDLHEGRSGDEIDELVEARGLSVETWVGQSSGGAYLSAMKEDTQLGLDLLADILRNPAFPEDKIKLAKEGEKAGISRRNDDPMTIARREAMKVIFRASRILSAPTEMSPSASGSGRFRLPLTLGSQP